MMMLSSEQIRAKSASEVAGVTVITCVVITSRAVNPMPPFFPAPAASATACPLNAGIVSSPEEEPWRSERKSSNGSRLSAAR